MKILNNVLVGLLSMLAFPALAQNPQMTLVWSSEKVFDVPESALCSHTEKLIFVSNISGNPSEKDGKGFISTLSFSGKVFNLRWIEGLDAPKGMSLVGKTLYVADVNDLVQINVDGRRIEQRFNAPQSVFLNDVVAAPNGDVYVSDSKDQTIYQLKDGVFSKWLSSDALASVNGLTIIGDTLFAGTSKAILAISLKGMEIDVWASVVGGIDGLEWNGKDAFVFSDWQGHIYSVEKGKKPRLLLDTTANKVNAADIGFNQEKGIVYVPTFFDNRVVAYKVE